MLQDVDLKRGAVTLDENKTDDPRAWALSPGGKEALAEWKALLGKPEASDPVFVEQDGKPIKPDEDEKSVSKWGLAEIFRSHLKSAGVVRPELFENKGMRKPIRVHDLRATFVTISLANDRTEAWVSARTAHRSSSMINRYRRAARKIEELGLGNARTQATIKALGVVVQRASEGWRGPPLRCCDGQRSPTCFRSDSLHQGCCSDHGGICDD